MREAHSHAKVEEDGQRRATVNAKDASEALQNYGGQVGLNEGGRQMLSGVAFADDEQALDILVDHNTESAAIAAEDLQLASVEQGNFRVGATRLTGMSAGGNFLSDGDKVEIFAKADSVDASELHLQTPAGPVTAGRLELSGFLTEASYARDKQALDAGSATTGRFRVDSATVSDVDLMGVGAESFSADALSGQIDVDGATAGLDAKSMSASTLVNPEAIFASTNMGNVIRSISPPSRSMAFSRSGVMRGLAQGPRMRTGIASPLRSSPSSSVGVNR